MKVQEKEVKSEEILLYKNEISKSYNVLKSKTISKSKCAVDHHQFS